MPSVAGSASASLKKARCRECGGYHGARARAAGLVAARRVAAPQRVVVARRVVARRVVARRVAVAQLVVAQRAAAQREVVAQRESDGPSVSET